MPSWLGNAVKNFALLLIAVAVAALISEGAVRLAGFKPRAVWTDDARLFSIHWLESR